MTNAPSSIELNAASTGVDPAGGSIVLCPGQGAQFVGMAKQWIEKSDAAKAIFAEADDILGDSLGGSLRDLCFDGPEDRLNQTDIAQPAIYTCSVACWRGLLERGDVENSIAATAGLSLGEYTALHLAGAFSFADGLRLVAQRGRWMQDAAEQSQGSMVALIGADEEQAVDVCERAIVGSNDAVLVCANFNAPGQIVLSGDKASCDKAVEIAGELSLRATALSVAGAFHSPLMQPAADAMGDTLAEADFNPLPVPVWSNVTGRPHDPNDLELLRLRLVEQITQPVRWAQSCAALASAASTMKEGEQSPVWRELAPGKVLKGLQRRIDRDTKVTNHDEPE